MENNFNIEDLFKNTLGNAEATPPAGAWEAIQAKMGVTAASTAAGTAATGLGIGKIAAIVVTALGIGLGAGYLAFKGGNTAGQNSQKTPGALSENSSVELSDINTPALPDDVKITEVSSVNKADKVVSIVEVKKDGETKKIRVEVPAPAKNTNPLVNHLISPKDEKAHRERMIKLIMEQINNDENTANTETQPKEPVGTTKENATTVQKDYVEAGIQPVINGLTVHFSNLTSASRYEWEFGDGATSTEASPVHTYASPNFYVVSVKVYDKNGKVYTHKDGVTVAAAETPGEESSINKPNVFTPNGDGVHDEFFLTGRNIESFTITIMDKNNRVVFTADNIEQHWNGMDREETVLPDGKYYYTYKAIGKDGKPHTGKGIVFLKK